jgi:hypothetical protein
MRYIATSIIQIYLILNKFWLITHYIYIHTYISYDMQVEVSKQLIKNDLRCNLCIVFPFVSYYLMIALLQASRNTQLDKFQLLLPKLL